MLGIDKEKLSHFATLTAIFMYHVVIKVHFAGQLPYLRSIRLYFDRLMTLRNELLEPY